MPRTPRGQSAATARIYAALKQRFPDIPDDPRKVVYQYNSAIRIRVISSAFAGVSIDDREEALLPLLNALPIKMRSSITNVLLLTAEEAAGPQRIASAAFEEEEPDSKLK